MSVGTPGAPNRTQQRAFLDALEGEIASSIVDATMLGLLLVQLKGIEALNLSAGYRVADQALTEVAAMLERAFGARGRVVRIGTSRFAVVLRGLKSEAVGLLAANRVERLATEPLVIGTQRIELDFVQGLAFHPAHAKTADQLLQCAELALGLAKDSGAATSVYRLEKTAKLHEQRRIEGELFRALEQGGIEAYFQPQIDIVSGRAIGAEALLRCRDRDGAMLSPEEVVAAAERTNRLGDLTSTVLNTALRYAAEWPEPRALLSVNVSTHSLKDPDFPMAVANALGIWNRAPEHLTVEITESAFIDEPEKSLAAMRELKALGVRVSIDDFGTGYSSLSYFTNIPANELKVDKSFVLGMLGSDGDRRIVQAVVNLAHGFDLEVVAEGVEDEATLAALRDMGCDIAQGYWVGKPMAPAQFLEWLATARGRTATPP